MSKLKANLFGIFTFEISGSKNFLIAIALLIVLLNVFVLITSFWLVYKVLFMAYIPHILEFLCVLWFVYMFIDSATTQDD
jgi:hypothetical protein